MSSDENPPSPEFKVPNNPVDMSLSQQERAQVTAFYKKRQEMIANNRILLDCPKCLIIFSDMLLYRMHMVMHGSSLPLPFTATSASFSPFQPLSTWQCSLCKRQCTDRIDFQCHTIQYEHSMIPQGIGIPNNLPFHNGFPDLSSLIPPSELIKELANILKNGAGRQS
ncbi:hypothetical protein B9Z55_002511 [Caenorhabditis nigoni]|uniref:C2H2-type domain-containing protein n=2 Tax=Caenorhabditis nigoni TaxID=1611254 RepID=A0A2G5VKT8_9PELO|nr:hypothetical protein B9Z55_002511 [Caenorhabditis nigoni]